MRRFIMSALQPSNAVLEKKTDILRAHFLNAFTSACSSNGALVIEYVTDRTTGMETVMTNVIVDTADSVE